MGVGEPIDMIRNMFRRKQLQAIQSKTRLVETGVECKSKDEYLGWFLSLETCAAQAYTEGAKFFIYGRGPKMWLCWKEDTASRECPEGLMRDSYDFYELVNSTDTGNSSDVSNESNAGRIAS